MAPLRGELSPKVTEGWPSGHESHPSHPSPAIAGAPLKGSLYSTVGANTVRPGNCASGPDSPGGYGIRPYGVGEHLAGKTMPASQQSWPARAVQCPAGALIVARPRNSICSRAVLRHRQTARANTVRPYSHHGVACRGRRPRRPGRCADIAGGSRIRPYGIRDGYGYRRFPRGVGDAAPYKPTILTKTPPTHCALGVFQLFNSRFSSGV